MTGETRDLLSRSSHLRGAAELASHAPSILNTQPWRWAVFATSLELWADRARHLPTIDPDLRLLTLSCGAALHHVRTALAADGDETRVERLPDPTRPDLLARVSLRWPSAQVSSDRELARFAAISRRRTDRRPFTNTPIAQSTLDSFRAAAEAEGTHFQVLDDEDVTMLAAAADRADRTEVTDPAYRAELRSWTHRPTWSGDGVPEDTAVNDYQRRVPLRDFTLGGMPPHTGSFADRMATYAILWGETEEPIGWLRAGEALSAIMLDATVEDLALSPISGVVEVEGSRLALRGILADLGYPYLAVRIGHPPVNRPAASPRRHNTVAATGPDNTTGDDR